MACNLVTTTIKDTVVSIRQLSCVDGLDELSKLLKVLGKVSYEYLNGEANIHHHLALLQNCSTEDTQYIMATASKCVIDGKKHTAELIGFELENNYLLLMEVFAFFVSANYKEFFTDGLQLTEERKAALLKQNSQVKTDSE